MFSTSFTEGKNCDFLLLLLEIEAIFNGCLLFKERNCSSRSKFFLLRVERLGKGEKHEKLQVSMVTGYSCLDRKQCTLFPTSSSSVHYSVLHYQGC